MTEEEKGELIYLRKRVKELERENVKLQLQIEEYQKKYWSARSEISYMRGDDQYDI